MKEDKILKETHALKSDLNGMLLLTSPKAGLVDHPDEEVRKKVKLLKSAIGHVLLRIRNIEREADPEVKDELEDYFEKFDIPKPKGY